MRRSAVAADQAGRLGQLELDDAEAAFFDASLEIVSRGGYKWIGSESADEAIGPASDGGGHSRIDVAIKGALAKAQRDQRRPQSICASSASAGKLVSWLNGGSS